MESTTKQVKDDDPCCTLLFINIISSTCSVIATMQLKLCGDHDQKLYFWITMACM